MLFEKMLPCGSALSWSVNRTSLATLFRAKDGNIYLGEDALNYRAERLAKIAEYDYFVA